MSIFGAYFNTYTYALFWRHWMQYEKVDLRTCSRFGDYNLQAQVHVWWHARAGGKKYDARGRRKLLNSWKLSEFQVFPISFTLSNYELKWVLVKLWGHFNRHSEAVNIDFLQRRNRHSLVPTPNLFFLILVLLLRIASCKQNAARICCKASLASKSCSNFLSKWINQRSALQQLKSSK